ncbi:MAG: glycosyltransferase, partial [Tateyamaria sp.]
QGAQWFTRLRALDGLRFRYDPWLRASYTGAELVMGVAPYMRDVLADVPLRRFEPFLGIGVADLEPETVRDTPAGQLKMLHVGRAVRTKGLRDVVRALSHLKDNPEVTLTSIGDGEELEACRAEAEALGVADRVSFLGRLPRAQIEDHYKAADALVYPSFRESMGAVLYEAMRWSLPVVTVRAGGPDYIIDDTCGLKVDVTTPQQMPQDLARCITTLAADPALRQRLGQAGRAKLAAEALWPLKAQKLMQIYQDTLADASRR